MYTLIAKRVADALKSLQVRSYNLGTLRHVEQRYSPVQDPEMAGFTVGPLSDFMPEDVAIKYGGPLGLVLPMTAFYCLKDPASDRLLATADLAATPAALDRGLCQVASRHPRCFTPAPDDHIDALVNLEVKHKKRDEMLIWTWPPWPSVVAHQSLLEKMQAAGFSGYALRPATVRFRDGFLSREYKRLLVRAGEEWHGQSPASSSSRLVRRVSVNRTVRFLT